MKKLILCGIVTMSFFANIKPASNTQDTWSYQWFSSAIADDDDNSEELEHILIEHKREDEKGGSGGGNSGDRRGGGSPPPGGGGNGQGGDSGGGIIDAVEECEINEVARHQTTVNILNVAKVAGEKGCDANGLGVLAIATLFGQPVPGAVGGVLVGAVCHGFVSYVHGQAISDATQLHETNKAKCD